MNTEECVTSWLKQSYPGDQQFLFGVDDLDDPVCAVVNRILSQFPEADAELAVCTEDWGVNPKVSKLAQLVRRARHDHLVVSDADVFAPEDLLVNLMQSMRNDRVGLANCLYRQATSLDAAMQWEAVACNADFWSQVLQSRMIKPMNFALGAVMAMRKKQLEQIGGFEGIADCLADDYQLGRKISLAGHRIELCPVVVECQTGRMGWGQVWRHQVRWSRTIRVCQPVPYFLSILSNGTVWPVLLLSVWHHPLVLAAGAVCLLMRMITGLDLQRRLSWRMEKPAPAWMIPLKDLLQIVVWASAFVGNRIEWHGRRFRLRGNGTLLRLDA